MPTISIELKDAAVCLEDEVSFKVLCKGLPLPTPVWTKKGVVMINDERTFMRTQPVDTHVITFTDVRMEDYGKVGWKLKNKKSPWMTTKITRLLSVQNPLNFSGHLFPLRTENNYPLCSVEDLIYMYRDAWKYPASWVPSLLLSRWVWLSVKF